MGIAEWFSEFCWNIQVKDNGTISNRYKAITRRLNTDYWETESDTSHSLYVGSYGRNTAIEGFSDLDMVFELPSRLYNQYDSHNGNGQSALLQAVRAWMQKTYSTSDMGADGQVLVVNFQDGIRFEVMPVFNNNEDSYTYPDSNEGGKWRATNPRPEIQAIRDRNESCNNNLIPLCRMMRAWKNKWEVPIDGLLVDTLAYQFIEHYEYRDKSYLYYDYFCRDLFKWMSTKTRGRSIGKRLEVVNTSLGKVFSSTKRRGVTTFHWKLSSMSWLFLNKSGRRNRNGERSLEQHSRTEDTPEARSILEGQLRECYGRVVYSHKTHEKCADILLSRLARIKMWQIILSAVTTAGFIGAMLDAGDIAAGIGMVISTGLLVLNSYSKNYDLGELAQKHKQAANGLWLIREKYLTLLVDLAMRERPLEAMQKQRDELVEQLHSVYSGAPSTTFQAYGKAQEALKRLDDMTFTDSEIDAFLPKELKRG